MATQNIPGDVIVKTISLFTDKGTVNILEHVKGISIYESIFTPGIAAELSVWDTQNMSAELPILAGQRVLIEIQTPGRESAKYDLVISKIRDAVPADNIRTKSYVLMCTSPEVLRNAAHQLIKSYNTNISNMVKDIVTVFLGSKKTLDIQQTRGSQKVLIQSMNPFDAITMLRHRAMSSENKSSSFVFFENQNGINFKTLENLMTQDPGDRVFTNDDTIRTDMSKPTFRNIICYEQPQQTDAHTRIMIGGLRNNVRKFDFKTLEYTSKSNTFNPSDFKNPDGTMKKMDSSDLDQFKKASACNRWVMHDSSNPDTFIADGLGQKVNALAAFGDGSMLLEVFGDTQLTAGQVIEVKSIENATSTTTPKEHRHLSGNYLIAFLRHIIGTEGNNPRYTCSIEAIKGGFKEAV